MSTTPPNLPVVSKIKKDTILGMISKSTRVDGRKLSDIRRIEIKTDIIPNANGSAHVKLGRSQVIVGVKAEIGSPYPDTPNEGVLIVNAEFVPLASPTFEPGPPDERAIELARVIDRSLRELKAIELDKLAIIPGKRVWTVFVDIYVIDHDGNLVDASSLGTIAALKTAKIPKAKVEGDDRIELSDSEYMNIPLRSITLTATIAKIDEYLVADPVLEEEAVADTLIIFSLDSEGRITGIQKSGNGYLSSDDVRKALEMAKTMTKIYMSKLP